MYTGFSAGKVSCRTRYPGREPCLKLFLNVSGSGVQVLALRTDLPYYSPMTTKIFILLFLAVFMSGLQGHASADQEQQEAEAASYETEFRGDIDSRMRQILSQVSDTVALKERTLVSVSQLKRRVRDDIPEFVGALRSFGYYAPDISYTIHEDETPMRVVFQVNQGPEFLIQEVEVISQDPGWEGELPDPEELGLYKGERIRSSTVKDSTRELDRYLKARGHPFSRSRVQEVVIDHADNSAAIYLAFDPGPRAWFGDLEITGLERVQEEVVQEKIPWEKGDEFRAPQMEKLRRDLSATGLFSVVEVNHGHELDEESLLPMQVRVRERSPRTFRAGIGYQSDIGPELRLGWMHRNLRGRGETLEADLQLSDVERFLGGSYTIPSFMRPDQRLILKSGYREEYQDAYDSTSLFATGTVDRDLTSELSVGAGAGYRLARVEQMGEKTDLGLLFFPGNLLYDARDNELDPSQGLRFNLRLTPFLDTMDLETRFLKTYASLSKYLELWPERIVLANRVAYGAIGAEDKRKVPPDERYYAGGGGSIRGYAYQKVGPMEDGNPIGGLALAEINTELRFKLSRNSGLVLFLDGGQAYENSYPDFSENLRWGTGIGYRYYTDFGPLRADIAFPLNRRSKDSAYQLYLSIGQAF